MRKYCNPFGQRAVSREVGSTCGLREGVGLCGGFICLGLGFPSHSKSCVFNALCYYFLQLLTMGLVMNI